jgi:hypothetical protein
MNWTKCGRKRAWPDLKYYPRICVKELRKTIKDLKIFGVPDGIQTSHLQDKIQKFGTILLSVPPRVGDHRRDEGDYPCGGTAAGNSPAPCPPQSVHLFRYLRHLNPGEKEPVNPTGVISRSLCLRLVIYSVTGRNRPNSRTNRGPRALGTERRM